VPTHDHPSRRRTSRAWIMCGGKMCFRGSTMPDHSVDWVSYAASHFAGAALWSQVSTYRHGGGCARPRATPRSLAGPRSTQGAWVAQKLYSAEGEAQGGGDGRGLKGYIQSTWICPAWHIHVLWIYPVRGSRSYPLVCRRLPWRWAFAMMPRRSTYRRARVTIAVTTR